MLPFGSTRSLVDERDPRVSPLVGLELAYMHEIGRARDPAPMMLAALRQSIGLANLPLATWG
jgi:hypothetical protein